MKLQMVGCSHRDAAVELREKLSFTPEQARAALDAFRETYPASEAVLLSTCNRVELYTATGDAEAGLPDRQAAIDFLAQCRGVSSEEIFETLIYRTGAEAVEHLFTVAASLDSMVVGEAQILNQVKQAYEIANARGATGPLTHAVFQAASHAAKRVQRETKIHRRRVSIPSVAVGEVAKEFFDSIDDKSVLLIGAGEMGQETMRYLCDWGARDVVIVNRSEDRAAALAAELGGRVAPWHALSDHVARADLVVSTTGASEPVVTAEMFTSIHEARFQRLLLILDLAIPRDFDPRIGDAAGVYLYAVDDLQAACERNRKEREREWPQAQKIIAEETRKFIADLHHRATGPVIRRLREQAEQTKQEELKRLLGRLEKYEIDDGAYADIEQGFDRLVNKLLHPPLSSLRDDAARGGSQGLLEALRRLFDV